MAPGDDNRRADGPAAPRRPAAPLGHARAEDVGLAEVWLGTGFCPAAVAPADEGPFGMDLAALDIGTFTAGLISFDHQTRVRAAEPATNYHVNVAITGSVVSTGLGARERTGQRPAESVAVNPGWQPEITWSRGAQRLCLMLPPARLESELESLLGRTPEQPLQLSPTPDDATFPARTFASAAQLVLRELETPMSRAFPSLGLHLEGLLIDSLLLGHQHTYSEELARRSRSRAASTAVSRAAALMHERPAEPWTTVGLASEVHLSPRALQEGFRRHHGRSPMAYLRWVRLRRVHALLATATPSSSSVRELAVQYGFVHLGRFAAAYRREFGEYPSQTLARSL